MDHWLDTVITLLSAETKNLRELAKLAGGDPATFYLGARFDGVDLSGQDLRGMQLPKLRGANVLIDKKTQLDEEREAEEEHQERQSQKLSIFDESDWYNAWIGHWRDSSRDAAIRQKVASDGERWLETANAETPAWSAVFDTIWLSERRTSSRRDRLFDLATRNFRLLEENSDEWLIIWGRLWRHDKAIQDASVDDFFHLSSEWLHRGLAEKTKWLPIWSKLGKVRKSETRRKDLLLSIGNEWLLTTDYNNPTWATVWSDLWDSSVKVFSREHLISIGMRWLVNVDERHFGWSKVWRRIWSERSDNKDIEETLQMLAEGWLDRNVESDSFGSVWSSLWNSAKSDQLMEEWLLPAGLSWLQRSRRTGAWTTVWKEIWDHKDDKSVRTELVRIGINWLQTISNKKAWPQIWERIWIHAENDPFLTEPLSALANMWLEKYPGRLGDTIRLRMGYPLREPTDRKRSDNANGSPPSRG